MTYEVKGCLFSLPSSESKKFSVKATPEEMANGDMYFLFTKIEIVKVKGASKKAITEEVKL